MDRKEILEKSQQENIKSDPVEKDFIRIATNIAFSVGLILCCLLSVLNLLVKGHMDLLLWVVYFLMFASREICLFFLIKEKKSFVFGVFLVVLASFFMVAYLGL